MVELVFLAFGNKPPQDELLRDFYDMRGSVSQYLCVWGALACGQSRLLPSDQSRICREAVAVAFDTLAQSPSAAIECRRQGSTWGMVVALQAIVPAAGREAQCACLLAPAHRMYYPHSYGVYGGHLPPSTEVLHVLQVVRSLDRRHQARIG